MNLFHAEIFILINIIQIVFAATCLEADVIVIWVSEVNNYLGLLALREDTGLYRKDEASRSQGSSISTGESSIVIYILNGDM